jgi:hypothetical protein
LDALVEIQSLIFGIGKKLFELREDLWPAFPAGIAQYPDPAQSLDV